MKDKGGKQNGKELYDKRYDRIRTPNKDRGQRNGIKTRECRVIKGLKCEQYTKLRVR
jgi:hypothetical protein